MERTLNLAEYNSKPWLDKPKRKSRKEVEPSLLSWILLGGGVWALLHKGRIGFWPWQTAQVKREMVQQANRQVALAQSGELKKFDWYGTPRRGAGVSDDQVPILPALKDGLELTEPVLIEDYEDVGVIKTGRGPGDYKALPPEQFGIPRDKPAQPPKPLSFWDRLKLQIQTSLNTSFIR